MIKYYILVKPHAIYVKDGEFFVEQGGITEDWGINWEPVYADSIEHARCIGKIKQLEGDMK